MAVEATGLPCSVCLPGRVWRDVSYEHDARYGPPRVGGSGNPKIKRASCWCDTCGLMYAPRIIDKRLAERPKEGSDG